MGPGRTGLRASAATQCSADIPLVRCTLLLVQQAGLRRAAAAQSRAACSRCPVALGAGDRPQQLHKFADLRCSARGLCTAAACSSRAPRATGATAVCSAAPEQAGLPSGTAPAPCRGTKKALHQGCIAVGYGARGPLEGRGWPSWVVQPAAARLATRNRHNGGGDRTAGQQRVELVAAVFQAPGESALAQLLEVAVHRGLAGAQFGAHLVLADLGGAGHSGYTVTMTTSDTATPGPVSLYTSTLYSWAGGGRVRPRS